jgi:hypothetical protein
MKNLTITLGMIAALFVLLGAATHACHSRGGRAAERYFRSLLALVLAGLFGSLIFVSNYYLASTGLKRSLGAELLAKDPILRYAFAGSKIRSCHLFAICIIGGSFLSAALFMKSMGLTYRAIRKGAWRNKPVRFASLVLGLAFALFCMGVAFYADTTLLLFRTATMMWTDDLATTAASLPDVPHIVREHAGTMGAALLHSLAFLYPVLIILADKYLASSYAHLCEASRQLAAARALQAAPQPAVATPIPVPPLVPPAGAADGFNVRFGVPNAPAPGGAAPWVRPVPFNPGPLGDDGRPVHGGN